MSDNKPPPAYTCNQPGQPGTYSQPGQAGYSQPGQAGYSQPGQSGFSQPGQAGVYGQPAPVAYGQPGGYSSNVVMVTQPGAGMTARPGSCRHCGIGYPHTSYTVCGILLAILFFPLGILCCLMLTERRCTHCGAGL